MRFTVDTVQYIYMQAHLSQKDIQSHQTKFDYLQYYVCTSVNKHAQSHRVEGFLCNEY